MPSAFFNLESFVAQCVAACDPSDEQGSIARLRKIYEDTIARSYSSVRAAIPNDGPDEVLLHEDDRCTVYLVRVPPNIKYPPHDHKMVAVVGVFEGVEVNDYFSRDGSGGISLPAGRTERYKAGQVAVLDTGSVHGISSEGVTRSQALHVYCGNLGKVDRQLFSRADGRAMPFTMENYFGGAEPPQPIPTGHDTATTQQQEDSGLPTWLDEMLKPGVSTGIFNTLKLSLVLLVLVLGALLTVMTDETVRLHVSIFLGMSVVLLCLVVWFIGELQKAEKEQRLADKQK